MPTELALLPFIESAFNPQAVSSARAAGMWQFMPATGKDFDLKQNVFRDDRRDVLASTARRARLPAEAVRHVRRLAPRAGRLQLGEGNVSRAIARNQRRRPGASYTEIACPTRRGTTCPSCRR
jgi:membrane-bound lytic murein transglycosylase D